MGDFLKTLGYDLTQNKPIEIIFAFNDKSCRKFTIICRLLKEAVKLVSGHFEILIIRNKSAD